MPPPQNSIRTSGSLIQRSKLSILSSLAVVQIEPSASLVRTELELEGADHVCVALEREAHPRSVELLITRASQEQMPLRVDSMEL